MVSGGVSVCGVLGELERTYEHIEGRSGAGQSWRWNSRGSIGGQTGVFGLERKVGRESGGEFDITWVGVRERGRARDRDSAMRRVRTGDGLSDMARITSTHRR